MKNLMPILVATLVIWLSGFCLRAAQLYPVVDTGQTQCYDNRNEIALPKQGQPFYGQDHNFTTIQPAIRSAVTD